MDYDEFLIFHELNDNLCQFNNLLEQSEIFVNRFFETMKNFKALKRSHTDKVVTINKKMESFEAIEKTKPEIPKLEVGKLKLITELEYEFARRKELKKSSSLNQIDSKISNGREIGNFNKPKEFKSVVATGKETGNSSSIKKTESDKTNKEMLMSRSIIEIESENATRNVLNEYKEKHGNLMKKFLNLKNKFGKCQILIYGKVSTGKSKIINAILGKEIFHSASSHTTSCFVKIRKSSDQSHHIEYKNRKNLCNQLDDLKNKIKEMSTEFSKDKNKLEINELLTVYLNIPDNKILTSSTEIIDCPGSANRESITNYIKDKALNSNIFIFVLTSGIADDDEVFFQYQLEQSSKPIIFILVNKWDQAYNDGDDVAENSKMKITEGLMEFLTKKIKLSTTDARKRIFFVSSLDICKKRNIGKTNSIKLDEYAEERCQRFENFEMSLSQFIKIFIETNFKNYEGEICELRKEISTYTENFMTDLSKNKNIENIDSFKNFRNEIKISLDDQVSIINTTKENSLNQIQTFINQYESKLNRSTIQQMENELNNLIKDKKIFFQNLQKDINEFIDDEIKKYKKLTMIDKEKGKDNLKEAMKMDIKLTGISETSWERFCHKFTSVFTFLKEHFQASLNKKDSTSLKEIHDKIDSEISDLNKSAEEYLNSLSAYLLKEINEMVEQLDFTINVYSEFSTNIDILFKNSN